MDAEDWSVPVRDDDTADLGTSTLCVGGEGRWRIGLTSGYATGPPRCWRTGGGSRGIAYGGVEGTWEMLEGETGDPSRMSADLELLKLTSNDE